MYFLGVQKYCVHLQKKQIELLLVVLAELWCGWFGGLVQCEKYAYMYTSYYHIHTVCIRIHIHKSCCIHVEIALYTNINRIICTHNSYYTGIHTYKRAYIYNRITPCPNQYRLAQAHLTLQYAVERERERGCVREGRREEERERERITPCPNQYRLVQAHLAPQSAVDPSRRHSHTHVHA